jgi:hypothetical protein
MDAIYEAVELGPTGAKLIAKEDIGARGVLLKIERELDGYEAAEKVGAIETLRRKFLEPKAARLRLRVLGPERSARLQAMTVEKRRLRAEARKLEKDKTIAARFAPILAEYVRLSGAVYNFAKDIARDHPEAQAVLTLLHNLGTLPEGYASSLEKAARHDAEAMRGKASVQQWRIEALIESTKK